MKAVVCRAFGAPSLLTLEDWPAPAAPGPRDVRLAVKAAGVNFADSLMIAGRYQVQPRLPFVPGLEAAGVVIETGPEVTDLAVGDHAVALMSDGAFAEQWVGPEERLVKIPRGLDFITAAAFSIAYGTAHMGLERRARLQPGEVLVVTGAGGGAGLAAVEVGRMMGARVIAAAGSAAKLDLARRHGADETVNYRTEDLRARVLELTGGRGADVAFDPVGGDVFKGAFRSLAFEGRMVVVGFASGTVPQIPANHLLVKNIDLIGLYWGGYKVHDIAALRQSAQRLAAGMHEGRLKPHIGGVYPLHRAGEALDLMLARLSLGKLVLTVD